MTEQSIRKHKEGSGCSLFYGTVLAFIWEIVENHDNLYQNN
jgi:hypothetical protein